MLPASIESSFFGTGLCQYVTNKSESYDPDIQILRSRYHLYSQLYFLNSYTERRFASPVTEPQKSGKGES